MKTHIHRPIAALLLSFLSLSGARAGGQPPDPVGDVEKLQRQAEAIHRRMAALPPQCTIGSGQARKGNWLNSFRAMPEPGNAYGFVYLFDAAPAAVAVRAALNPAGLRALEKVEYRDAEGKWIDAGPVSIHDAPAGCDHVWLQQDLGGARRVDALRYTLRHTTESVTVSEVAVLK
jgi:hypothetical protein